MCIQCADGMGSTSIIRRLGGVQERNALIAKRRGGEMSLNSLEKQERNKAIAAWVPVGLTLLLWLLWTMLWGGFWLPTIILVVGLMIWGVPAITATIRWHKIWKLDK